ncbi:MAG TPA: LysR family transcriptional regulator [Kofleriaceae bacterium]|nr:LysR family transcriptional regulator [Kofleriaceae bacterium]
MNRAVNLAALDLNLLVALDALLAETHVGRAGRRIGLSQPATSHALGRLRELFGDPLLVRVGSRMELTPRAHALRGAVARALEQVRGLFLAEPFDPATSARRFLLMMPDLVVETVMPSLLARISAEAPQVRLDVVPWRDPAMLSDELARSLDLAICCTADVLAGFHRQRLYTDTDVLAVRRGHPVGARLARLRHFLAARHVAVIGTDRAADYIDAWLREQDIERRIALTVPSYLQALRVAAQTDLVAFVPSRLVAALRGPLALQVIRPPLDPGVDVQVMAFPRRAHADPASIWLRTLIAEIADRLPQAIGLAAPAGYTRRDAARARR